MDTSTLLLVPEKADEETEAVVNAWKKKGGEVKRLGKYWVKEDDLSGKKIAIYGNQTFALILAQVYHKDLVSPDEALIARLEERWIKRKIRLIQIGDLAQADFPVFVKPLVPKLFTAGVYPTKERFDAMVGQLDGSESILVSEVIADISAEVRAYVMGGDLKDMAFYEGFGSLNDCREFLIGFLENYKDQLPEVLVVDLAYSEHSGWFILEFNACWGAGLNHCRAEKVISCIISATRNRIAGTTDAVVA